MMNPDRYLELAAHAEDHAKAAVDPALRAVLSEVAEQWRALADYMADAEDARPATSARH